MWGFTGITFPSYVSSVLEGHIALRATFTSAIPPPLLVLLFCDGTCTLEPPLPVCSASLLTGRPLKSGQEAKAATPIVMVRRGKCRPDQTAQASASNSESVEGESTSARRVQCRTSTLIDGRTSMHQRPLRVRVTWQPSRSPAGGATAASAKAPHNTSPFHTRALAQKQLCLGGVKGLLHGRRLRARLCTSHLVARAVSGSGPCSFFRAHYKRRHLQGYQ